MRRLLMISGFALLTASAHAQDRPVGGVSVLYAGSLVDLMERGIGPAFGKSTGGTFQGTAGGSKGLADQIKDKSRRGDVFVSASPKADEALEGPANGDWVRWVVDFAQSPLVIGYAPSSRFAAALKSKPWYEALQEPGIRIGRTDPETDPKGTLTVQLLKHAEQVYHQPGLTQKVLGKPVNPAQIFPEADLVSRLRSGQIDVGFFYSMEVADLKFPTVSLPSDVALSAHFTVTTLRDGPNPVGAVDFVAFLLGPEGRALMRDHGLDVTTFTTTGDANAIPPAVQKAIAAAK